MLRQSRINKKLSAHKQIFGTFNYQRTPLAPLGTKVIIHERPKQRASWAPHGKPGFLVSRAKDHYRSFEISVEKTGGTRTSDAIEILPTKYIMPKTSSNDRIIAALEEIAEAVKNSELRSPFMNGRKENEIIKELSEIFDRNKANTTEKQQENSFFWPHLQGCPPKPQQENRLRPCRRQYVRNSHERLRKCEKLPRKVEKLPQAPPRVMKIQPCGSKRVGNTEIYCNGTVIYKKFNHRTWRGEVQNHDARRKYY